MYVYKFFRKSKLVQYKCPEVYNSGSLNKHVSFVLNVSLSHETVEHIARLVLITRTVRKLLAPSYADGTPAAIKLWFILLKGLFFLGKALI